MEQNNLNSKKKEILNSIDSKFDHYLNSVDCSLTIQDQIGLCLMFAYKYKYQKKEIYFEKMNLFFNNVLKIQSYQCTDIVQGTSSVLWLIKFLKKMDVLDYSDNDIKSIERTISNELARSLLRNNWDYYHGAIGYALALDKPEFYKVLVQYFIGKIKKDDHGNYYLLSEFYNESTNLGLHAGILGILSITNTLILKGLFVEDSKEIQKRILEISFRKINNIHQTYFPALFERNYPSRMCWAYGELTFSSQLFITGRINSDDWLLQEAHNIALLSIKRDSLDNSFISDSCIINGSSGNHLLYQLINKIHPCNIFHSAEQNWLTLTENILKENDYQNIDRYTGLKNDDLSLLSGLSGVYLSIANFDSTWHEYILLPNIYNNIL